MTLQSAKYLFKLAAGAQKKEAIAFPFDYLNKGYSLLPLMGKGHSVACFTDHDDTIEQAIAIRALWHVSKTTKAIAASKASKEAQENELFARMKLDMIRVHME